MSWKGGFRILVSNLFELWHERGEVFAWLNVGGRTHGLGAFLFSEAGQVTYDPLIL